MDPKESEELSSFILEEIFDKSIDQIKQKEKEIRSAFGNNHNINADIFKKNVTKIF